MSLTPCRKAYVKDTIHSFMGKVFEDMCRHYTLSQGLDPSYADGIKTKEKVQNNGI